MNKKKKTKAAEPLTAEQLESFRSALEIVRTGKGSGGETYNNIGQLNQAAWIGEHSGALIAEIERLRPELRRGAESR